MKSKLLLLTCALVSSGAFAQSATPQSRAPMSGPMYEAKGADGKPLSDEERRKRGLPVAEALTEQQKQIDLVTDPAVLKRLTAQFKQKGDFLHLAHTMARLYKLLPYHGLVGYEAAAAYAQIDDKRRVYDLLIRLQMQGYAFDVAKDERFEKARGTGAYDYILQNIDANRVPFGEGKVAITLPAGDFLYEALAFDPKRDVFLLASMREGTISRVGFDGKAVPYIKADANNGLLAIQAMAVDAERNTLWVAANGLPHQKSFDKASFGKARLFQFELDSGKFVKRFDAPANAANGVFNALTVSAKGDVFVCDGAGRRIHMLRDGALVQVVQNPRLTGIHTLVAAPTGDRLYFSDYELGIMGIDLATGKGFNVLPAPNLTEYGVEGMAFWKGHLLVVQSGFTPRRVMRLTLTADGTKVEKAQPLDAGHEAFGMAIGGVVAKDKFYFIANSQRHQYDHYGVPKDVAKLEATRIFASDPAFALK